ncbi:MAG: hypothetical protein FWF24_03875 [Alphaproteobacteria bacterium]|nr:hypothetical protein [Alphaproteobacteria bacterium]
MSSRLLFAGLLLVSAAPAPASAEIVTPRDLRMTSSTTADRVWGYQPGQGPMPQGQALPPLYAPHAPPRPAPAPHAPQITPFDPSTRDAPIRVLPNPYRQEPTKPPPPLVHNDWRNAPSASSRVFRPELIDKPVPVQTRTALDFGGMISYKRYKEPSLNMSDRGFHFGGFLETTYTLPELWFMRGELRLSGGSTDYKGSGTKNNNPDYLGFVQATVGRDFIWNNFALTPYGGLGFRFLINDLRGKTSTGHTGYKRTNMMIYAPLGLEPRMVLDNGDMMRVRAELRPMIRGWQESGLSALAGYPDIRNTQSLGIGVRTDFMYDTRGFSFGPFIDYWRIGKSNTVCATGAAFGVCGYEPSNSTFEFGFKVLYRFWERK